MKKTMSNTRFTPKHYYGQTPSYPRINPRLHEKQVKKAYKKRRDELASLITQTLRRIKKTEQEYQKGGMTRTQYKKEIALHKKTLSRLKAKYNYYDYRIKNKKS